MKYIKLIYYKGGYWQASCGRCKTTVISIPDENGNFHDCGKHCPQCGLLLQVKTSDVERMNEINKIVADIKTQTKSDGFYEKVKKEVRRVLANDLCDILGNVIGDLADEFDDQPAMEKHLKKSRFQFLAKILRKHGIVKK